MQKRSKQMNLKRVDIQTSYFANYRGNRGISIARYKPKGYTCGDFPALYPPESLLSLYKSGAITESKYEEIYYKCVLSKLDPYEVVKKLRGRVVLCYDGKGKFCHRHIVSKWIFDNTGIHVKERK